MKLDITYSKSVYFKLSNGTKPRIQKYHNSKFVQIHQNVILMVQAAETDKMYKDLMDKIACSQDSKECMVQ